MKSTLELDCILMEIIEKLEPLGYCFEKSQLRNIQFQRDVIRIARSAYKITPNCDLAALVGSFATKQMELLFNSKGE
jgi:hypothetical protein